MLSALAGAVSAQLRPRHAWGRNPRGFAVPAAPPAGVYQGVNVSGLTSSTEQSLLNVFKATGSNNNNITAWSITGSTTFNQLMAVLDPNGYPTSLPGGNAVRAYMNGSMNNLDPLGSTGSGIGNGVPPGASTLYPSGSWSIQFQGACTLTLSGDPVSGSLATSSPNVSVSGLTITSTMTSGQTGVVTFNVTTPSSAGMVLSITALPSGTNYFRNAACVRSSQLANYNAGAICDPNWIASITNNGAGGYKRLRFMDALNSTVGEGVILTYQVPALTTSSSLTQTMTSAWTGQSITLPCVLGNAGSDTAQNNTVTLTYGSTTAVFGSAFTQSVTGGATNLWIQNFSGWSTRNVPANAFWQGGNGTGSPGMLPYEICIAMANATNTDCWINIPIWANSFTGQTGFWSSLATLVQSNLNSGLKVFLELGNEVFLEGDEQYCNMLARTQIGVTDFTAWMGWQLALISQSFATVFGSSFSSTVRIGPSTEFSIGNGVGFLTDMMNGTNLGGGTFPNSYLAAAPYTYFTHWSFAPYFPTSTASFTATISNGNPVIACAGNTFIAGTEVVFSSSVGGLVSGTTYYVIATGLSSSQFEVSATLGGSAITPSASGSSTVTPSQVADLTTMMGVTNPLNDFFNCMYSNVGTVANGSVVYPSVQSSGWVGNTIADIAAIKAAIASQPWASYPVHCYESGPSFPADFFSTTAGSYTGPYGGGSYTTMRSAVVALYNNAHRDPRMGYALYDPTHQLSSNPGFLPAATSAGCTTMNYYNSCGSMSQYGDWGALENVMQIPSSGGSGTAASYPCYAANMAWNG